MLPLALTFLLGFLKKFRKRLLLLFHSHEDLLGFFIGLRNLIGLLLCRGKAGGSLLGCSILVPLPALRGIVGMRDLGRPLLAEVTLFLVRGGRRATVGSLGLFLLSGDRTIQTLREESDIPVFDRASKARPLRKCLPVYYSDLPPDAQSLRGHLQSFSNQRGYAYPCVLSKSLQATWGGH